MDTDSNNENHLMLHTFPHIQIKIKSLLTLFNRAVAQIGVVTKSLGSPVQTTNILMNG